MSKQPKFHIGDYYLYRNEVELFARINNTTNPWVGVHSILSLGGRIYATRVKLPCGDEVSKGDFVETEFDFGCGEKFVINGVARRIDCRTNFSDCPDKLNRIDQPPSSKDSGLTR